MEGLSAAANVAGIISLGLQATKGLLEYYQDCKGREKQLALTTKKLDRLHGMLEILDSYLKNLPPPSPSDSPPSPSDSDKTKLLGKLQGYIEDCEECINDLHDQCNKFRNVRSAGIIGRAISAARKLTYPLRTSTLATIDEAVDETVPHISLALQIVDRMSSDHDQALHRMDRAKRIEEQIHEWLAAPEVYKNYTAASKKRHSNTGDWLVKGEVFSSWLADANSFLWLYGFAGCGKSVLCSTAISEVIDQHQHNTQIGIAYFFFTFNDNGKQDVLAMLRAIVLQLAGHIEGGREILSKLFKKYKDNEPLEEVLIPCLLDLIRSSDETYILLDALDECPLDSHRKELLNILIEMRKWSEHRLHLLVTSRDEPDIRHAIVNKMGAFSDQMIPLRNSSIDNDIATYIAGERDLNLDLWIWSDYHDYIQESLTKRANGVFRWVECQITRLAKVPKGKRFLDDILASLPQTLDETYQRMLENIEVVFQDDARRLLTLLCCSTRPLTVAEVIEGIAVQLGDNPRLDIDSRLQDEDDILKLCPGLIEIDRLDESHGELRLFTDYLPWNYVDGSDGDNALPDTFKSTVRIAHFSVQEYLESERISKGSVPKFRVHLPDAHAEIASVCLTYVLNLPPTRSIYEYALTRYATDTWADHYRRANICQHGAQDQALRLFGPGAEKRQIWMAYAHSRKVYYSFARPGVSIFSAAYGTVAFSLIYYAAVLGLPSILVVLLNREPYCNLSQEEFGQTIYELDVLEAAAHSGNLDVVELLVEKGALSTPSHGGAALGHAIHEKNYEMARHLIGQGADVNHLYCEQQSSLLMAVVDGNVAIAGLLIERGAKAMTMSPMTKVCDTVSAGELLLKSMGNKAMFELLVWKYPQFNTADVDKAAVPKCNKEGKWTGLNDDGYIPKLISSAAYRGLDSVSLLLDYIAETKLSIGTTRPLILALANYSERFEIVQLLAEKGMQVSVPLAIMVYSDHLQHEGSQEEVQLLGRYLIAKCVDVGLPSFAIEHVIETLASHGLMEMAGALLQESSGLDDDARISCYSGALQHAAKNGRCEVIKQLLAMGADVNFEGGFYSTALHAAVVGENEAVVRLLIENGANVNALRDGSATDWNDMDDAEEERNFRLSNEELLRNAFKDNLGTALHVATTLGNSTIVELLIEKGADVELQRATTGFASKAMEAAVRRIARARPAGNGNRMQCSAESVDLAVYCEAMAVTYDVDKRRNLEYDVRFCTPLQAAIHYRHEGIARFLIESGAQITNSGGHSTPLHIAADSQHMGIFRLLVEMGADVNLHCETFGTPLQALRGLGSPSIYQALIKNGADINFQCKCHTGVLQVQAVGWGGTEILQLLIENGADVNLQSSPKGTAVLAAASTQSYDMTKLLLENGADPTLSDGSYDMPILNRLRYENFPKLSQLLEKHGCRQMMWVAPEDFIWPAGMYVNNWW